ncbi:hypothetical protein ACIBG0_33555 [Nocardia sp. NPDC050630]|uniref:hypothetical protein n=1 Tax=Nocardia sp. NPDC050630 TaxID=3364321 RepID=UPI00378E30AD
MLRDLFVDPPDTLVGHPAAGWAWTVCAAIATVVTLILMPIFARRERTWLWITLVPAGAICFFMESVGDWLGATWYPPNSPLVIGEVLGRPMPFYLVLTYAAYFPLGFWACYQVLKKGPSTARTVGLWIAGGLVNCAVEITFTQTGAHVYYGDNPVRIFGLPLYSIIQNGAFPIMGGAVLLYAKKYLRGRRQLWLLAIYPLGFVGFAVIATWPMYVALNAEPGPVWTWVAAIAAVTMNLVLAAGILFSPWLRNLQREAAQDDRARQGEPVGDPAVRRSPTTPVTAMEPTA